MSNFTFNQTIILAVIPVLGISIVNLILGVVNRAKISAIHIQINSRMDELLRVTSEKSMADGKAEGVAAERFRVEAIPTEKRKPHGDPE